MASDTSSQSLRPSLTVPELIAFVKKELDTDEERQAKIALAGEGGSGVVPDKAHSGHTLDLSHKNIEALPVQVVALIKERVERLALSHNPRIQIPLEIAQCDKLRYLNLRWNKLRKFPQAVLSLSRLEILDISKNAIDGIPEGIRNMTNLKFLAVARNQIRRLPLALGEMKLVKLKFDENPIEFPPPDVLEASVVRTATMVDSEKDKDMCEHVKKYMRARSIQESLRSHSSQESISESQDTTPRPTKRGVTGGRFPVRPSISSIDGFNPNASSSDSPPNAPPPIPQRSIERSHGRGVSSNEKYSQPAKRPHVAPLYTGGLDTSRSRSETVASAANPRRQGFVPARKTSQLEMNKQLSARSNPTPALTPPHSRAPSVTSSYNNYLAVGSGNESSSGAVSPTDGTSMRAKLSRKLASLPESRNSRLPTSTSVRAVKRVLYMLAHLYGPVADIAQQLRGNSPRRTRVQLQLFRAHVQSTELERMLNKANSTLEDNVEIDTPLLATIVRAAIKSLREYGLVVKELSRTHSQDIKQLDGIHVRCVITTAYTLIVEARNVCLLLGFKTKPKVQRDTIRASQAWSSRTVTPTHPTSANSNRRRGNTILPSSGSVSNVRGIAPPVPLHTGSRTNTMTSIGAAATPRYNASFEHLQSQSAYPSRSNTMRNTMTDTESEDTPDKVYLKLKACCDLAHKILPPVRGDLLQRKILSDNAGQMHSSRQYLQVVRRCESVIAVNDKLLSRLRTMRVGDAARYQKEFSQMTESFGQEWTNFVSEIVSLNSQRIDVGNVRRVLRPLQQAVKDANRATQHVARTMNKPPPHPGIPQLNTALAQHAGQVPPVPVTPLGAALGPAVQATVPPTPTTSYNSPDYYPQDPMRRPTLVERSATALPLSSYPRR
ncbi:hypothetical protein DOTSEDRAFT_72243 [Dothistroma septosporum NZE10]|uniref:Uncharacterized protein n=1 Tax=Dothistroma septosporum (strain NZE10 / CBS 128990) TaxID=675120 RepID=N1PP57_DOTSN|nr:hypothetical protein DOTSEDRAFT_72243 [Dothistroma septosporum NZE10]